jgi:hypothetical protein
MSSTPFRHQTSLKSQFNRSKGGTFFSILILFKIFFVFCLSQQNLIMHHMTSFLGLTLDKNLRGEKSCGSNKELLQEMKAK